MAASSRHVKQQLREPRASWLWAPVLGTGALAVNLTRIAHPALWRDEVATMVAARRSPSAIFRLLHHDDAPLGAYYLFMHFWIKISESALWLRLPSAIAAALAVVFLFLLGKRLVGTGPGVVAGVILAALPFSTRFAQEARPYALVMCGATAATWLLVGLIRNPGRRQWLAYSILLTATVLLHVFAVTLILAQLVTYAVAHRTHYRRYLPWLLSVLPAVVVATVVGLFTAKNSTSHAWIQKSRLRTPYDAAVNFAGTRPALALLLGAAVLGGCVGCWRARRRTSVSSSTIAIHLNVASVGLPWFIIPGALLIAISFTHPVFVPRYVLFSLPALALLAAGGAFSLWQALGGTRSLRVAVAALATVALIVGVAKPQIDLRRLDSHTDDPKAEAGYLISVSKAGDGIVYSPRDLVHSLVPYGRADQLPTDALLAESAIASATLNGVEVPAISAAASILRFDRLWVLEIPGLEDTSAIARTTATTLATHYHEVSATELHGTVLVLYKKTSP